MDITELRKLADRRRHGLGPMHQETIESLEDLANAYSGARKFLEESKTREEIVGAYTKKLGANDYKTFQATITLGEAVRWAGDLERARELQVGLMDAVSFKYGPQSKIAAITANNLAITMRKLGRDAEAFDLEKHFLDIWKEFNGEDDLQGLSAMMDHAETSRRLGRMSVTIATHEEVLRINRQIYGDASIQVAAMKIALAQDLLQEGRTAEALALLRAAEGVVLQKLRHDDLVRIQFEELSTLLDRAEEEEPG